MDKAYLIARMRASLAMARNAAGSAARLIHFELAGRYSLAAARYPVDDCGSDLRRQAFGGGLSSFHRRGT